MDMSQTTAPRSDQLNYDDVASATIDATVEKVTEGAAEQPVDIHLAEYPGRPWRPAKSMRRVLVAAWGSNSDEYVGRRVRLYGDPSVKFGGIAVGGIRVAALSHIEKPVTVSLTVTRGKRAPFKVDPLPDAAPAAPTITPEVWSRIQEAAHAAGVEQPGPWASEQLGRALSGPQEITEEEGARLLAALQGEEAE